MFLNLPNTNLQIVPMTKGISSIVKSHSRIDGTPPTLESLMFNMQPRTIPLMLMAGMVTRFAKR